MDWANLELLPLRNCLTGVIEKNREPLLLRFAGGAQDNNHVPKHDLLVYTSRRYRWLSFLPPDESAELLRRLDIA